MNKIFLFLIIFLLIISAGMYFYTNSSLLVDMMSSGAPFTKKQASTREKEEKLYKDEKTVIMSLKGRNFEKGMFGDGIFFENGTMVTKFKEGKKEFLVINGKEGKKYDEINFVPIPNPDNPSISYITPDGSIIYVAKEGGKYFVVIHTKDGDIKEGKRYDYIHYYPDVLTKFTPQGIKLAYKAKEGDNELVIFNDLEGNRYKKPSKYDDAIVGLPEFSSNGEKIAYLVKKGKKENFLVVNNKEERKYENYGFPYFSSDSKRLAYKAQKSGKWFMVVNGEEGKRYDKIFGQIFSPDSQNLAYVAIESDKQFVVINSKEGRKYNYIEDPYSYSHIGDLNYSPDSKILVYKVQDRKKDKEFVVVNEKEGKNYDMIRGFINFNSSNEVYYLADEDEKNFVVVGEKEEKKYPGVIDATELFLSPDGKILAYIVEDIGEEGKDGKQFVVINGREDKKYDKVNLDFGDKISFTPGNKVFYGSVINANQEDEMQILVVNNKEIRRSSTQIMERIITSIFSPDDKVIFVLAKLGEMGNEYFIEYDGKKGEKYKKISIPIFLNNNTIRYFAYDGENIYRITKKISD